MSGLANDYLTYQLFSKIQTSKTVQNSMIGINT